MSEQQQQEEEIDGEKLEHTLEPHVALTAIRQNAGTIMTDWQVATALDRLGEMSSEEHPYLKNFYHRTRDIILKQLPLQLLAAMKAEEKALREGNATALKRQLEEHREREAEEEAKQKEQEAEEAQESISEEEGVRLPA